ncbi:C-glycoside deglycosidase beta subunit domain-containing protein [Limosilactobacillus difficilis]|uniref:C-glycoside deglycosidase beta subunit domain-containing protein n=1 Tax=Limosilactobacillus difficilis TaxID=2991838 RepID=UPI0024BA65E9|nr:DUF6379 domain-containing protein [Limosilactobacillus difficilis]
MFDNNVFIKGTCHNFKTADEVKGFELQTNITYYRGIPLSMVHDFNVWVDGVKVDPDQLQFSVDGKEWFTKDELTTVSDIKWEYGEPATIRVNVDGGLSGKHRIKLNIVTVTAYIPVPLSGFKEYEVDFSK